MSLLKSSTYTIRLFSFIGCLLGYSLIPSGAQGQGLGGPLPLSQVNYWGYQIQSINEEGAVDNLAASHYDMLVLEPTRTDWSSDDKFFDKPGDWPDYILLCDPDGWAGNYPVAYWDADWKDIIIYGQNTPGHPDRDYDSVIDEVIKAGFDGIYLDWVEAFENEDVIDEARRVGKDPAVEMIGFIKEMRDYARQRNPDFLIIQQNAASLIDGHANLANVIDAIAQEAIWYDGDATDDWEDPGGYDYENENDLIDYYLGYLDDYQAAGLPVFDCEYARSYANDAYQKASDQGFIPYATRRSLGALTTTPPPGYGIQNTSYYVAPTGNDANPGSAASPWRTIQHAANTLVAGETVTIRGGVYNDRIIPHHSGAEGNYIVYTAYPGETVTIDGAGITLPADWGGLFDISGQSYIKVSGLRLQNAGPHDNNTGILVDESSHIIIERNYTYNTASSGIGVWDSDHIIIDGNEVELANNDGEQENITIAGTDSFEVMNNHVHHGGPGSNGGEGIDAKDGSSNGKVYNNHVHDMNRLGIYVDAWDKHTHHIEVFQNRVHDCEDSGITVASESGGLLENITVHNNVVYNNLFCGFDVSDYSEISGSRPMRHIQVLNNTFYNNGRGAWGGGICVLNPDIQDMVLRNNLVSQNLSFQMAVEPGVPMAELTVDYNLIDGYRGYDDEIRGDDYVEGDPMFVNPSGADFHLLAGSPAIDAGSSAQAPGLDYEGNMRPHGAGIDIGAFEYVASSVPIESENDVPAAFRLAQNYPNPFNPHTVITYALPKAAFVTLRIFNVLGEEVATLISEPVPAGRHTVGFGPRGLASGPYFYQIEAGPYRATRMMLLMR